MQNKFKISLQENGIHSFNKGLNELAEYEKNNKQDDFKLKEAIMFIHHGIELLLKQVLINKGGEYLIFADLQQDTIKKIIRAKKNNVSVFSMDKPVYTATYSEAIDRVKAFIDSPTMNDRLEENLKTLNALRNNLEHYGIDKEKKEVEKLLLELNKPISQFFLDAGIDLGDENRENWTNLEKELLIAVSRLRAGGQVKRAELKDNNALVEYVKDYTEYKKYQPQSLVTEEHFYSYWDSGYAILKAVNDGGVRLLREFDVIEKVSITVPFKKEIYTVVVGRREVEEFLGYSFDEIKSDWDNTFSNEYVYSKEGRAKFFKRFGKIEKK